MHCFYPLKNINGRFPLLAAHELFTIYQATGGVPNSVESAEIDRLWTEIARQKQGIKLYRCKLEDEIMAHGIVAQSLVEPSGSSFVPPNSFASA